MLLSIISAIENDEERSFIENIYEKYSKQMYMIANDILNNHHDAEDIVHDTILKIIDKIDEFRKNALYDDIKILVLLCARNLAINKYRQNQYRGRLVTSTVTLDSAGKFHEKELEDSSADIENIVACEENLKILQELINELEPIYRDVFILLSRGFTYKEISHIMEISEEAVRQRYHRGKAKILQKGGDKLHVSDI